MSMESTVFDALKSLVASRVFPDLAPENTVRPFLTYSTVGGSAVNFLSGSAPSKRRYRVQIDVWGDSREEVSRLAIQVEDALRATAALSTFVEGAPVSSYEQDTKLRGSMQDFSFIF